MMNANIKKMWLAALRSGQYQQGKESLKTEEGKFCCLGVLCDISRLGKWEDATLGTDKWYTIRGKAGTLLEQSGTVLPEAVRRLAGLKSANPVIVMAPPGFLAEEARTGTISPSTSSFSASLAALNDFGNSFEAIADIIENEL